ncbi:hypothetical protein NJF44_15855 [Pseudomonas guariconensis]|uniref:hypothetical protein n=1 Tax=Pseudomonas TaxID=286 RepID=UPI002097BF05|nr:MULTISPECIES: hypothetical protein [Pseudomonas]MCO7516386.1 hypothetical protein [Pseudomonas putida]MCO7606714.1 hypothetical protein [Pseudomonas guariconensis]
MMLTTRRNWLALALGLFITTPLLAAEPERPPVADKVVAYSGEQGIKVWTLRIGERSVNQALVQVDGIDHDWQMRIQKMNVEKSERDTRYSTEVDGKKYVALIVRGDWANLYLPGEAQETSLRYDPSLSEQGNAQYFLTDYLQQAAR